jgi:hypothetical protein
MQAVEALPCVSTATGGQLASESRVHRESSVSLEPVGSPEGPAVPNPFDRLLVSDSTFRKASRAHASAGLSPHGPAGRERERNPATTRIRCPLSGQHVATPQAPREERKLVDGGRHGTEERELPQVWDHDIVRCRSRFGGLPWLRDSPGASSQETGDACETSRGFLDGPARAACHRGRSARHWLLSQATLGVGIVGLACLAAILARVAQASGQHADIMQALRQERRDQ